MRSASLDEVFEVGLAASGKRREKQPLSGGIKVGLDSYVDHDDMRTCASIEIFKSSYSTVKTRVFETKIEVS